MENFCVILALLVHTNSLLFWKVEDVLHDSTYWIFCAPSDKFCSFLTLAYIFCLFVSRSVWLSCSVVSDSATPWTVTHQAPLSMEFSRQEYRSGLPFPSPGDLPDPEIEPTSPTLQADSLPSEPLKGCYWTTKNTGILGLRRRRIQFGARDEAWSLRAFV